MHSAALWLQGSEGDRNEHFTTLSVGLEYHGSTAGRLTIPRIPHRTRGEHGQTRGLWQRSSGLISVGDLHQIESSDCTVTYGLFGKDDRRETLSTLRTR